MTARSDRPRRLRRLIVPAALIAAIALAITYARCGGGLGVGGGSGVGLGRGTGANGSAGAAPDGGGPDAGVPRCQVRVTATGYELDGAPTAIAAVVTACTAARAADVTVTGDARQGTWDALRAALGQAGVETFVRDPQAPPDAAPAR
jgi:hypothetical protein